MTSSGSDSSWSVRGNATPEELAAVVAVLSAQPAPVADEVPVVVSRWATRQDQLRRPLPHGPGAWRVGLH
jgi:hypothetical protein